MTLLESIYAQLVVAEFNRDDPENSLSYEELKIKAIEATDAFYEN